VVVAVEVADPTVVVDRMAVAAVEAIIK
jgi:hypothetical protein